MQKLIDRIDNAFQRYCVDYPLSGDGAAWQTLRSLVLAQQLSNTGSLQCPFILVERYADNGEHSHWSLVNSITGEEEWTQQASV